MFKVITQECYTMYFICKISKKKQQIKENASVFSCTPAQFPIDHKQIFRSTSIIVM